MSAEELARRAVACKGWRWLDGSDWVNGDSDGDGDVFEDGGESSNYPRFGIRMNGEFFELEDHNPCDPREPLPNLDDPATLGCFAFRLLPDAWGPDADVTVHADGSCEVEVPGSDPAEIARLGCPYRVGHGFENVVDCLEAAP